MNGESIPNRASGRSERKTNWMALRNHKQKLCEKLCEFASTKGTVRLGLYMVYVCQHAQLSCKYLYVQIKIYIQSGCLDGGG